MPDSGGKRVTSEKEIDMKALYEGTSRRKASLIIIDDLKVVKKRETERKMSKKGRSNIQRWVEEAPEFSEKFDKGKGGGPWSGNLSHS